MIPSHIVALIDDGADAARGSLARTIEADVLLECVLTAAAFLAVPLATWNRQLLAAAA